MVKFKLLLIIVIASFSSQQLALAQEIGGSQFYSTEEDSTMGLDYSTAHNDAAISDNVRRAHREDALKGSIDRTPSGKHADNGGLEEMMAVSAAAVSYSVRSTETGEGKNATSRKDSNLPKMNDGASRNRLSRKG